MPRNIAMAIDCDRSPLPPISITPCPVCSRSDPTVMGSTADYSMRAAHCTSVVVKGRGLEFPKEAHFLVACDGSKKSLFCIRQVLVRLLHILEAQFCYPSPCWYCDCRVVTAALTDASLCRPSSFGLVERPPACFSTPQAMANDDDKVKVVHVVARDQESLREQYRAPEVKVAAEAVIAGDTRAEYAEVEEDPDSAIADTIAELAISEDATYIAMGADGVRAFAAGKSAGLGSVSDRLVKISRVSVVVTQDNDSLI